jgi:uncharacterized coiled-coil protein SlyX
MRKSEREQLTQTEEALEVARAKHRNCAGEIYAREQRIAELAAALVNSQKVISSMQTMLNENTEKLRGTPIAERELEEMKIVDRDNKFLLRALLSYCHGRLG